MVEFLFDQKHKTIELGFGDKQKEGFGLAGEFQGNFFDFK